MSPGAKTSLRTSTFSSDSGLTGLFDNFYDNYDDDDDHDGYHDSDDDDGRGRTSSQW